MANILTMPTIFRPISSSYLAQMVGKGLIPEHYQPKISFKTSWPAQNVLEQYSLSIRSLEDLPQVGHTMLVLFTPYVPVALATGIKKLFWGGHFL